MFVIVSPSYAQTEPVEEHAPAEHAGDDLATEVHAGTEAHGEEHGAFPPFDPATFGSQLLWLAITFGILYLLMQRVAIPRIGSILEERDKRIAGDLAEAGRMKAESDAAVAAYEQALATARQDAHKIAQEARDTAKSEVGDYRNKVEGELNARLGAAETEIANVKGQALANVDAIARDAVEAMVEALVGAKVGKDAVARAVADVMAERA
jgi:F-type H+-transporting ATPase subunit b